LYEDPVRYQIGDIVCTRKSHPCGSVYWEITRTGMDFGMKCCYCSHRVMIPRRVFERAVKALGSQEDVARQKADLERRARNRPKRSNFPSRPPARGSAVAAGKGPPRGFRAVGVRGKPPERRPPEPKRAEPKPAEPKPAAPTSDEAPRS
jgi:hypothetical protein